jgi:hypothetical protein
LSLEDKEFIKSYVKNTEGVESIPDEMNWNKMIEIRQKVQSAINLELGRRNKIRRRKEYRDDAKKAFQRITKPQGGRCDIDPNVMADHYATNWEDETDFDRDRESTFITPLEQNEFLRSDSDGRKWLTDEKKIEKIIRYKGLISAPGNDKLTYGLLKAERDGCSGVISKLIETMLLTQHCPESWKSAKTILLPKPCPESEKNKPGNWRPITLTSIIYRIIMNQFSNFLQSKKNFKCIVHPSQKGFKKNIEGCSEHAATLNYLIAVQ